jgi:hypothetical protein
MLMRGVLYHCHYVGADNALFGAAAWLVVAHVQELIDAQTVQENLADVDKCVV